MATWLGNPTVLSADGVAGTSGQPTILYGASILSTGGGAAVVDFVNGIDETGAVMFQGVGTTSKNVQVADVAGSGLYFPLGLFVDFDANTSQVVVWIEQLT